MLEKRYAHTATLLSNGKVMLIGGINDGGQNHSSVELYDPLTNAWTLANSINVARDSHTATILHNGRVLIAAGFSTRTGQLGSAEIYTPPAVEHTWTPAVSMNNGRYWHAAAALADGRVLVVGGSNAPVSTEIYDPVTGFWIQAANMNLSRSNFTVTLLNDNRVMAIGGYGRSVTEIYDPSTDSWVLAARIAPGRDRHTATRLLDGRVLVAGGIDTYTLNSAEIYDPLTDRWTPAGRMTVGRYLHSATLLPDGRVLVAGGCNGALSTGIAYFSSAEIYDPATNTWTPVPDMSESRSNFTSILLPNGQVLVAGGVASIQAGGVATTQAGDRIFRSGAELYDPVTNSWTPGASMHDQRTAHTGSLLVDGRVLVAGGNLNNIDYLASSEIYDPLTDSWTLEDNLNTARNGHTATLLPDGRVLITGGGRSLTSAEIYGPVTGN